MFQFFKNMIKKESKAGHSIYLRNQQAAFMKRNFAAFAEEGYKLNVIAYQAINKKAKAVAQIPWVLKSKDGKEITDAPILTALNKPNPAQSFKEWLEATIGFYSISGNNYWEKTENGKGDPLEFYSLRPDRMLIKIGADGMPAEFIYKVNTDGVHWDAEQNLIRHCKTFNPLDDVYGMSPIEAAAYSIDQHNESNKWLQGLLQNGAAPSGVLAGDDVLSEEAFNRLKAEIDEKYSGGNNAGRPMLLEGGLKWQQLGLSPQNMSIIETKLNSARDIALALEVPPLLLNIQGDSTYSNYKEARLAFYEETVIPLAQLFIDEFNDWNEDVLNGNKFELDLNQIPAMIDKRMSLWDMADRSTDLTINEKREMKGYDPIEGGDEIYINTGQIPLSFDADLAGEGDSEQAERDAEEAFGKDDDANE